MKLIAQTRKTQANLYSRGVICSPLLPLQLQTDPAAAGVFLKLENLQPVVRCYKLRGALNALYARDLESLRANRGVVTASAGNFAQGLALACHLADIPLSVLMPRGASPMKAQRIASINRKVRIIEVAHQDWWTCMMDASTHQVTSVPDLHQATFISPATDPEVIGGNATIGIEIAEATALANATEIHVMVPYGGGGLITGLGRVLRTLFAARPRTKLKIFACEVSTGAPLHASLARGRPTGVKYSRSFVDGIGAPAVLPAAFAAVKELVDESLVVTPEEVAQSCAYLLETCGMVVEGAGAVSLAAARRYGSPSAHTVCVVSGGNVDPNYLLKSLADLNIA
jgi:threonine dehydratase